MPLSWLVFIFGVPKLSRDVRVHVRRLHRHVLRRSLQHQLVKQPLASVTFSTTILDSGVDVDAAAPISLERVGRTPMFQDKRHPYRTNTTTSSKRALDRCRDVGIIPRAPVWEGQLQLDSRPMYGGLREIAMREYTRSHCRCECRSMTLNEPVDVSNIGTRNQGRGTPAAFDRSPSQISAQRSRLGTGWRLSGAPSGRLVYLPTVSVARRSLSCLFPHGPMPLASFSPFGPSTTDQPRLTG